MQRYTTKCFLFIFHFILSSPGSRPVLQTLGILITHRLFLKNNNKPACMHIS